MSQPPIPPIPPKPPVPNQTPVTSAENVNAPVQDSQAANTPTGGKPKRSDPRCRLALFFSVLSLLIFLLIRLAYKATIFLAASPLLWIVLGLGIISLITGLVLVLIFISACRRQKKPWILKSLMIFGILGVSIHYLIRVIIIIFFATAQAAMVVGGLALCTPQGMMVVSAVCMIDKAIKDHMANSTGPEWRMIKVDYLGSNLPETPGKASFLLTNTGPHKIKAMRGKLHAWSLFHVDKTIIFETTAPLEPNQTLRVDFMLDGFGGKAKDIIEGKNNDVQAVATNTANYLDENLPEDVPRAFKSSGPAPLPPNPQPEIAYHLRFQMQNMTTSDGTRYVAWLGNMELADKNAFFEVMRDFTSPEWKMIKVEKIDNEDNPGQASFRLINNGKLTIASMKGKFHVMGITKDHLEKTVTLSPDKPLAPGESMVFTLPAGSESDLAGQIILRESKNDLKLGNKEQTSYLMRFQLQELHTSDGRKIWIWFGDLKGDIQPEDK